MIEYLNDSYWLLKAWTESLFPPPSSPGVTMASAHPGGPCWMMSPRIRDWKEEMSREPFPLTLTFGLHPVCDVMGQATWEPSEVKGMAKAQLIYSEMPPRLRLSQEGRVTHPLGCGSFLGQRQGNPLLHLPREPSISRPPGASSW